MARKTKKELEYQRRLINTRIFANALFRGEVKLMYEIHDKKKIAIYVPKNPEKKNEN